MEKVNIKRSFVPVVLILVFLSGCSGEFWKHDTVYKNYSHIRFSLYGYKHPTEKDIKMSERQGWWGKPIKVGIIETDLKE